MNINTIADLKFAIKDFDDECPLVFQIVAADGTAWNMSECSLFDVPGQNYMVGITMRHPLLKTLPKENEI